MASTTFPTAQRDRPVRLFLSYAREDRDEVALLAGSLEQAGFRVWWDAALEGGHHFAAEIERELEAADAVVVVWSAASVQSNWVLDEAMHGRDRGCLIPVRFDDSQPPLGFRQIQSIQLEDGADAGAAEAIGRAAARIMGQPVAETGALPRSSQTGRRPAKAKREYPLWWPFAWAIFGLVVFLILNSPYFD
jgi:hypothetical protein